MPALFLETIRLQAGRARLLDLHQQRMQYTGERQGFRAPTIPQLEELLPEALRHTTVKCRVIYRDQIESISFDPYQPRTIQSLALVALPAAFDYSLKYLRRDKLDALRLSSGADEVLLIDEQGFITDSTFSNLLFRDPADRWYTPRQPLLHGVMRHHLLSSHEGDTPRITERDIRPSDLPTYCEVAFVNAMLPFSVAPRCPISAIKAL